MHFYYANHFRQLNEGVRLSYATSHSQYLSLCENRRLGAGSLLFLAYVNCLPQALDTSISAYAEVMVPERPNREILRSAINNAWRWYEGCSLSIDDDKWVGMNKSKADQHISHGGFFTLAMVDRQKLLGFWLDSNFSFLYHYHLASKAFQTCSPDLTLVFQMTSFAKSVESLFVPHGLRASDLAHRPL